MGCRARSHYELWAEKALVDETLYERRMFGEFGHLEADTQVFLCQSSEDKGKVRMLHDDLKRLGVKVWLDENKIKVGDSIVGKVSQGLEVSRVMILCLSPSSVRSIWACREWQSFLSRQLGDQATKLLPILLKDCEIPGILSDIKYADFRESYHDGFKEVYEALNSMSST